MRLFHHWTSRGYKALNPSFATSSDIWQIAAIELGFEHAFLLHGILALSAVYKASFLPPAQRQDLLQQADVHITQALDTFRKHLEAPKDVVLMSILVLSSVLLTYNFGSVQKRPKSHMSSIHHCLMLLNGFKVVVKPHWERLKDSLVLAQLFEWSSPDAMHPLDTLSRDDERPDILCLLGLTEFMHDAQDKIACTEAIEDLHSVSIRIKYAAIDRDECLILFNWAARAPNRFYELLPAHNPVTFIVTIHFIALFAQARPVW
jgi:hypothetical protein